MVVHPNCPRCGGRGEIFASMYYCPRCRIRYEKDGLVVWENGKDLGTREIRLQKLALLERSGRFEEAARVCESMQMFEEAEKFRSRTREVMLQNESNLEKAGRFEEAACIYESLQMWEEAGRVRAKGRQIGIVRTEVSVDLNKLLEQVREGGIVAVYRCPHCGGKLKIGKETTMKSLKICEHCGYEIDTMDMADFLKTVLT